MKRKKKAIRDWLLAVGLIIVFIMGTMVDGSNGYYAMAIAFLGVALVFISLISDIYEEIRRNLND